jgi:hypothetical protein
MVQNISLRRVFFMDLNAEVAQVRAQAVEEFVSVRNGLI